MRQITEQRKEKKKEYNKEYHLNNKDTLKPKAKEYYQNNKEIIKAKKKEYLQLPEVIKRKKEWSKQHKQRPEVKEKIKEYMKGYFQRPEVKTHTKKRLKEYQQRPEVKAKKKEYLQLPEVKAKKKEYMKERYTNDPIFKITETLRTRVRDAIKTNSKSVSTKKLIGCSIEYLMNHLESQFDDSMGWYNHGFYGWHIDHIKPCASFNLTDPEQQRVCFHFTNLQPLWAEDNMSKGRKEIKKLEVIA